MLLRASPCIAVLTSRTGPVRVQEALRPILLRRMKEDVETLPEKEEVGGQQSC